MTIARNFFRPVLQALFGTVLVFLVLGFAVPLSAQGTVSGQFRRVTVRDFFREIEQKTGYTFAYVNSDIDLTKTVTLTAENEDVISVVNRALAPQDLTAGLDGKRIIIRKNPSPSLQSQTFVLSGRVLDDGGEPVIGAGITVSGTTRGVITGANGSFSIEVTPNTRLKISCLGYVDKTYSVGKENPVTFVLHPDIEVLSDAIVVGYGQQKKVNLTGAVAVVEMKEVENRPMTHASEAFYGLSGVYVNQTTSKPGSDGANIRIRGTGTLSSADPMVIVDGMEYPLADVNPDDIESISVLKDASASIYGSKAANGVILVTTKSGRKGAPVVRLKTNFGIQSIITRPDVVTDPVQFMELRTQAERNEGKISFTYPQSVIDEYRAGLGTNPYVYPATDWYRTAIKNGFLQEYNASVSGGNDQLSYAVAVGYMDQEGVLLTSDDARRYSWDMKLNIHVNRRLTVGAAVNGNLRFNTEPVYKVADIMSAISRALPVHGTKDPNGRYLNTWVNTPGINSFENPLMAMEMGNTKRQIQRFLAQLNVVYILPGDIEWKTNVGYNKFDSFAKDHKLSMTTYNPKTWVGTPYSDYFYNWDYDNNNLDFTANSTLLWKGSFGRHHLTPLAGAEYRSTKGMVFNARKMTYFNEQLDALSAGSQMVSISGNSSRTLLASLFGRLNYDYDEKYLAELIFRYDGSSKFAKKNQWGFFPALSLGWRIDKEAFLSGAKDLDLLKLRVSAGRMGNQAIGNYEYLMNVIAAAAYNYSFSNTLSPGAAIVDFVDDNITWEVTTSYDLGVDLSAFGNRLGATADVYYKISDGILREVSIPAQVGSLGAPRENIGTVSNKGFELQLSWRDAIGDVQYNVGGSVSYNRNKVLDIDGQEFGNAWRRTQEGYPIGCWWLYQADGFFNSQEEIDRSPKVQGAEIRPGYIRYKDINDDGIIDDKDRTYSGTIEPKWIYGFNFSASWKGLTLSANFQGVADVKTYLSGNIAAPFWNGAGVTKEWATDAWTEENHNARLPILHTATGAPYMHDYKNTQWQVSAAYLRCKSLQLSYNLPKDLVVLMGFSACQLFVNGNNIFTISPCKLIDPEFVISQTNLMQYPSLKTYNFGFNITF